MYYTDNIVNTDCDLGERAMNRKSDMTVAQLVDRYVEEILQPCVDGPLGGTHENTGRIRFATACAYRRSLQRHILPKWGAFAVADFEKPETRASVEKWFDWLRRSETNRGGLAPKSVRQLCVVMQRVFKSAVQWGYLGFNPFTERCAETNEVSENVTAAWRMEHEPGKEEDHHLEN